MTPSKPQFDGKKVKVKLADVCTLTMGQSPSSNSYNEIGNGIPFFQGNADFGEETPVPRVWCTAPKKTAEGGDLLISVRAPIGAVNMAVERCCIGRGIAAIHPNDDSISVDFLKHQLLSKRRELETMGTGSTFKAVGKKSLGNLTLVLYPEDTQREIERCLNQIKKQIKAISSQSSKLDSLVKSRFVEMFLNAEYPITTIGECAKDIHYGTSEKASSEGKYIYLRMNNIKDDGFLDLCDVKRITLDGKALENCLVRKGDLLFNRTNSRDKVGKTCVFPFDEEMIIAGYIIRVRLDERVNSVYLSAFMNLGVTKRFLRSIAKGAVHQANINAKQLASIEFPLPPIEVQESFVDFVRQVDKSRFAMLSGTLETLYAQLMESLS